MRLLIVISILLVVISCAEPTIKDVQSNDSLSVLEESIKQDSLIDDTSWYSKYGWQYEQVSYESLEDSFLKKSLQKYFMFGDEMNFPDYSCKDKGSINNCEHVKQYKIEFESQTFDSTKHIITRYLDKFIYLIDGKVYWGCDGGMPNEKIKRFSVKYKNEYISIPSTEYEDLYQPYGYMGGPFKVHLVNSNNSYVVVILHGSDGAGSYTAAWIFKDGKYIRRVVDSSC